MGRKVLGWIKKINKNISIGVILFVLVVMARINYFRMGNYGWVGKSMAMVLYFSFVIQVAVLMSELMRRCRKIVKLVVFLILMIITAGLSVSDVFNNDEISFVIMTSADLILFGQFIYLLSIPLKYVYKIVRKVKWRPAVKIREYVERLFSPPFLFPFKVVAIVLFYILKGLVKFLYELLKLIIEVMVYPFKSYRNAVKSVLTLGFVIYMIATGFVTVDYLKKEYGQYGKFFCSVGTSDRLKKSVVRIVGGYSEGSGFFISENEVLTNFHVIADEPSPKIIFPDGSFVTPVEIVGDKDADLAVLKTKKDYDDMVLHLDGFIELEDDEPMLSAGYPMGTDLAGKATVVKGNFVDKRKSKYEKVEYLQTNISLVEGMSGGPLTDQCGQVVGVNTLGLAGLSLFVSSEEVKRLLPTFSDQNIAKIEVNPAESPEKAVEAFYTYLKARNMEDGFELLSREYLNKTNFKEWTDRFTDVIDVEVISTKMEEDSEDIVNVRFITKNWNDGEADWHFYEGTWQTIWEDGAYKMLKSNIKELEEVDWSWYWGY